MNKQYLITGHCPTAHQQLPAEHWCTGGHYFQPVPACWGDDNGSCSGSDYMDTQIGQVLPQVVIRVLK